MADRAWVSMQRGLKDTSATLLPLPSLPSQCKEDWKLRPLCPSGCWLLGVSMQRGLKDTDCKHRASSEQLCLNAKRIESKNNLCNPTIALLKSQCKEDWKDKISWGKCWYWGFSLNAKRIESLPRASIITKCSYRSQCKEDWKDGAGKLIPFGVYARLNAKRIERNKMLLRKNLLRNRLNAKRIERSHSHSPPSPGALSLNAKRIERKES